MSKYQTVNHQQLELLEIFIICWCRKHYMEISHGRTELLL
ncbi:hypothetical protein HNR78_003397 [Parageobacillus toebii NBRC 107807]|uniref:Uncharacterized protein n=1 Tax=Parageobacillus toebii NBRC 107807 TaxID=1223503 RepID=A0AA89P6C9_9BACL|nr:hypothetical protein [Parageobacillus toebii NBRC 107807]